MGGPGIKRDGLKRRVANFLELPKELILDFPRITLVGNGELTIANHRGVIEYTPVKVVVGVYQGQVEVSGEDLSISHVFPDEIRITGKIAFLCLT